MSVLSERELEQARSVRTALAPALDPADQFFREAMEASVEPWDTLLGPQAVQELETALKALTGPTLAGLAVKEEEATAILTILFGTGQVPPEWWRTPLGRLVGPAAPDTGITQAYAAAILEVQRGAVGTMAVRGTLAPYDGPRPPSAGRPTKRAMLSRRSVLERLAKVSRKDWAVTQSTR